MITLGGISKSRKEILIYALDFEFRAILSQRSKDLTLRISLNFKSFVE